jgi:hypothetical protein
MPLTSSTKGVLLFAFNSGHVDYFDMACRTAKRINFFLNLPVTVITDSNTDTSKYPLVFDNIKIIESDTTNTKDNKVWINKGRHNAYELTPYDQTLVIDTDYLINSNMLLKVFDLPTDFACPNKCHFLGHETEIPEMISSTYVPTMWATVMYFKKTDKVKQLFDMIKMVESNYQHYVNLYNITSLMYRNDFALTIALRTIYGQTEDIRNYIPWKLVHLPKDIQIHKDSKTKFTILTKKELLNKTRYQYSIINEVDFHILDKKVFMELTNDD